MGFLRKVAGMKFCESVRSCETRKAQNVEPLLRIERSQLPAGYTYRKEVQRSTKTWWRNNISDFA